MVAYLHLKALGEHGWILEEYIGISMRNICMRIQRSTTMCGLLVGTMLMTASCGLSGANSTPAPAAATTAAPTVASAPPAPNTPAATQSAAVPTQAAPAVPIETATTGTTQTGTAQPVTT